MIDTSRPMALPLRADWSELPRTEFRFRTQIITSASGTEQRVPQNRYPDVQIRFQSLARDAWHAGRIDEMMPVIMTSAVAVRDFRMGGEGVVSADGNSVRMERWGASWAVGVRVIVEDAHGRSEHTAFISSVDPASRTITLDEPAPAPLRSIWVGVASAVVASVSADLTSERWHAGAERWSVSAQGFRGEDQIGGAWVSAFPFSHGTSEAISITHARSVASLDHEVGRRAEFVRYDSRLSGFRTYQVEARQMRQSDKEAAISFFCGCRGRWKSFSAPALDPVAKFRFASDILSFTHTSGAVSSATMSLAQVLQ